MSGVSQMVNTTMSTIVHNGLVVWLDAGINLSYPGSGSTWTDLVGNNHNASLSNSPTYNSNNGGYFTFTSASSQYATLAGTPLNTTSYTKSCWFYLDSTTDNNLISFDDGNGTGHYMFFGGTNKLSIGHTAWTGFPTTYSSTASFSNFTWYLVTVTFNTTNGMRLYINNSLDSSYTAQLTAPVATGIRLGSYSAGGNLLNGRISQVFIYNRSITATEVNQNFLATRSRYGV